MIDLIIFFVALAFFFVVWWMASGDLVETVAVTVVLVGALSALGFLLHLGGLV